MGDGRRNDRTGSAYRCGEFAPHRRTYTGRLHVAFDHHGAHDAGRRHARRPTPHGASIVDSFRTEASQWPQGATVFDTKTGEEGQWEWFGKQGRITLPEGVRVVDTLAEFKHWSVA